MSFLDRIKEKLASRYAHAAILALTLLLTAPALWVTIDSDDYFQVASLEKSPAFDGVARAPWDLYAYAKDRASNLALRDQGIWPWWADADVVVAFFRPLTSLTRWLDHTLWPDTVPLMQLHSVAWFAALLLIVSRLYRRWSPLPWISSLALFLFASDEARAATIAWLCNRNALVALTFGFGALLAHDRWRMEGSKLGALVAPLCFALGLLGGETALQVLGYLLAYSLFLDRGTRVQRLLALAPYGAVCVLWALVYKALGYGAFGSDVYVDPVREPLAFLSMLPERMIINALAMFNGVSADWFNILPLLGTDARPYLLPVAIVCSLMLVLGVVPLFRRDPLVRFWATGALLATLPACGVTPSDRMLTGGALGAMAVLAILLASLVDKTHPTPRRWLIGYAWVLAVINLGLAPVLRPYFISLVDELDPVIGKADESLPRTPDVAEQTWVLLNPPFDTFGVFAMFYREARDIVRPQHYRWLATGVTDLRIERVDERALKIAPRAGFLSTSSQLMLRSLDKPLRVGDKTELTGVSFEVLSLTDDGRPYEVLVRFDQPLEGGKLRFFRWNKHEYVPFVPPPVGQSVTVPVLDVASALQGES